MKTSRILTTFFLLGMALLITLTNPVAARAHCDTLDGPVVMDAKTALKKGDVTPVLKWVSKENESEIRAAFEKTLAVRKLNAKGKNPQAQELSDMYFFETLVRLHRAGEGAPYTGLKPAGADLSPAVKGADAALESGSVDKLAENVGNAVTKAIKEKFNRVWEAKQHANESVEAGREYVEAYVIYVHFVEGIHERVDCQGGKNAEPVAGKQGHQH